MIASFEIDEKYLVSITEIINTSFRDIDNPTELEMFNFLRTGGSRVTRTREPDEFVELRNRLEKEGFITIVRGSWNSDVVHKPFTVNGIKFEKGERFMCASALGVQLIVMREQRKGEKR